MLRHTRKRSLCLKSALWLALAIQWHAQAQTYDTNNFVVQTFAGSGFTGYLDGQGTQTMFNGLFGLLIVPDSSSNLFLLENFSRIRKIDPNGAVSTFVDGGNTSSFYSMTIDHSNVLWCAGAAFTLSTSIRTLFRIGTDARVTAVYQDDAFLAYAGMCVDSSNNVYISDSTGNKIVRYGTDEVLQVFAGSGNQGSADGNGVFTSFNSPNSLACDAADNIYVWDAGNRLVRRINQRRDVETVAGKLGVASDADGTGANASFKIVSAMCVNSAGDVIFACGSSIRKMTPTTNVLTMAGSFTQIGYTNGPGVLTRFNGASGVCISQGVIFVADSVNPRIRKIASNASPEPVSGGNLLLNTYAGLTMNGIVGRTYRIESSLDQTNWNPETTVLLRACFKNHKLGVRPAGGASLLSWQYGAMLEHFRL